ncbi:hypothetical protein D3C75_747950 [compost metagenome]
MASGVSFGTASPLHVLVKFTCIPVCSSSVGTSGSASERLSALTASVRSFPSSTYFFTSAGLTGTASTKPSIKAETAGPAPSKGICANFTPVSRSNVTAAKCQMLPVPAFPIFNSPGCAFAKSRNSFTVCHGASALTVMAEGSKFV